MARISNLSTDGRVVIVDNYNSYAALLKSLQDTVVTLEQEKNLEQIHLFEIDWDSRKITPPDEFKDFIGVIDEHKAETLTFRCNRWYDDVDLAQCAIVVEYVNALGEARVSPVLAKDFTTFKDQIIFYWTIDGGLTVKPGEIQFAVRFYKIGDTEYTRLNEDDQTVHANFKIVYSLRTLPVKTRIVGALPLEFDNFDEQYTDVDAETLTTIISAFDLLNNKIEQKELMWIDIIEE